MRLYSGGSQRANHRRELGHHVLEDERESNDIRAFGLHDAQQRSRIAAECNDPGVMALLQ
jgi:hypothetical protein